MLQHEYFGLKHVNRNLPSSFLGRCGNILGKCFKSGDETTAGAEIDWKTSNVVALCWLGAEEWFAGGGDGEERRLVFLFG